MSNYCLLLFMMLAATCARAHIDNEITPTPLGNLALPASQRPHHLFSFGQTNSDKGDFLGDVIASDLHGCQKRITECGALITYSVLDELAFTLIIPGALKIQEEEECSSGIEDISLLGEYAFAWHNHERSVGMGTVVLSIFFPTGSDKKRPPTGLGSVSCLTGITLTNIGVEWYTRAALGAILTTHNHGMKHGNIFLYHFGIGHNIPSPQGWIFSGMLEILGRQIGQDKVDCLLDCATGSNSINLAPCLWVSSSRFIFQVGVSVPVYQRVAENVKKDRFLVAALVGWKFK